MADNPFADLIPKKGATAAVASPDHNPFAKYIPAKPAEPVRPDFEAVDPMGNPTDATFAPAGATIMAGATGMLKPFAGALQYAGINAPARKLNELTKATSDIGGTSADVANFVGEMASPLPIKGAAVAEKILPKVLEKSALAKGAIQGLAGSAFNPTETGEDKTYGDFLSDKGTQLLEGAGVGVLLGKGSQMLLNPKMAAEIKDLMDKGVRLTPGQLLSQLKLPGMNSAAVGQGIRNIETGFSNIPIVGAFTKSAVQNAHDDFNRVIGNEILSKIGETLPKDVKAGHEMIKHIQGKVDDAYTHLTSQTSLHDLGGANRRLGATLDEVKEGLIPDDAAKLERFFSRNILGTIQRNVDDAGEAVALTGKQFRTMEKALGRKADKAFKNGHSDLGTAYETLQDDLRKELQFQNPALGDKLLQAHDLFKTFNPVRKAASRVTENEGVFGPDLLKKEIEKNAGTKKAAMGNAPMQQMAEDAKSVLGKDMPVRQPNSNNISAIFAPLRALAAGAISGGVYNPVSMGLARMIAGSRPQAVREAEPAISNAAARAAALAASDRSEP
jgi:hypothetical protein